MRSDRARPPKVSEFETWAPIPGFEGRWEASTEGRIYSTPRERTRGGVLVQRTNKRGYPSVTLGRDKPHEVHRLIAVTFLGPQPAGMEVRHLDGDKLNARASNLAYGTQSENMLDRRAHGSDHQARKTHCPKGHPYFGPNLLVIPSRPTARYCRACNAQRKAAARAARIAEQSTQISRRV